MLNQLGKAVDTTTANEMPEIIAYNSKKTNLNNLGAGMALEPKWLRMLARRSVDV